MFRSADGDALAKRNSVVLACAQALGGSSPPIVISLGGIVGSQLVTDQTFATVPVSLMQLGIACGVIPAAMLMRRLGRRNWLPDRSADRRHRGQHRGCGHQRAPVLAVLHRHLRLRPLWRLRPELPLRRGRRGDRQLQAARDLLGHDRRHRCRNHRAPGRLLDARSHAGRALRRELRRPGLPRADRHAGDPAIARAACGRREDDWRPSADRDHAAAEIHRLGHGRPRHLRADELPDDGGGRSP